LKINLEDFIWQVGQLESLERNLRDIGVYKRIDMVKLQKSFIIDVVLVVRKLYLKKLDKNNFECMNIRNKSSNVSKVSSQRALRFENEYFYRWKLDLLCFSSIIKLSWKTDGSVKSEPYCWMFINYLKWCNTPKASNYILLLRNSPLILVSALLLLATTL